MTTRDEATWVAPLGEPGATLEQSGGKGISLATLVAAGFPVPGGFLISTAAYRRFVAENDLQRVIDPQLGAVDASDPVALQRVAESILAAFQRGMIPPVIVAEIERAYAQLGGEPAVAVRSSASAEDLPGLSFAGQQQTFLNVRGEDDLLAAVRCCWASLWSARAMGYRLQMAVPQDDVAMAVVVQEMVPAEVSGVLFTVNPTSGDRHELVIEAAFGLGEAIVGGTVTPESYIVDRATLATTSFTPEGMEAMDVPTMGLETAAAPPAAGLRRDRAISDALLRELVQLGLRVEALFGDTPQDIEWAIARGTLWLLQARPITNLPEPPLLDVRWESPRPGATWVRRQVVEHMPEPLSPLFADLYLQQGLEQSVQVIGRAMGVEEIYERAIDGPMFGTVNGYGYSRGDINLTRQMVPVMARAVILGPLWLFRHGVAYWREEGLPPYLATIARWQEVDPATASDAELLRGVRELAWADAVYWFAAAIAIGTAKVGDWILDGFLGLIAPGSDVHSGLFLRGFPSKTLEADAELDAIARRVRESEELREYIVATPAERLLDALPDTPAGLGLREDLQRYFARYGHQIYNLDFVAPTLAESPLPVLLGLKALVREPGRDARVRQEEVARERDRMTEESARSFDPLRRFLFRRLVLWAQRYAPYREEALFFVGAGWPMLRRFARELGRRLAEGGLLCAADDVFFLESRELEEAIASRETGRLRPDLIRLARERRALRAQQMRLHPPPAVPPTARLQMGRLDFSERETQRRNAVDATVLRGFAVSPGRATAPASVIHSPADFSSMEPGTILVCPTTTPAWTPLFAQARGLVTDIGGILAHGSIVAREYGIPAVMGTGSATQRIASGQEITVDGSAGTVTLVG